MKAGFALRPPESREQAAKRVLVIDDSVVARAMLSRIFDSAPDFSVSAAFDRAERALEWLGQNSCDLILLDLEMPGRSGLTALPDLIAACGFARIIVVSSIAEEGANVTLRALALGAADVIAKPAVGRIGQQFGNGLISRLRSLATAAVTDIERPAAVEMGVPAKAKAACVGIGASTGGIHPLAQMMRALPRHFDAPILVTQHLPPVFMPFFAAQLETISGRSCRVANDGDPLVRGTILIAPGDGHLCVVPSNDGVRVAIRRNATVSRCLPSVDPMFESIGTCFGAGAFGVVLSGMGRDGADGAASLVQNGGTILVQDCESATIWGMPGAIARAGHASIVAPPETIAAYLCAAGSDR
jgi:two-component system, chemotaxis family, protein-glutamate methylesterase/glutaminase